MPFQEQGKREQRAEFAMRARRREQSFSSLCAEYAISRPTGYVWLKRFAAEGLSGLEELSRRPRNSPTKTPEQIERQVAELRLARPDWGARKLREQLAEQRIRLAASTVHRILQRQGLVPRPPITPSRGLRFERSAPNQLWQMDFKGPLWGDAGALTPLSVLDDHSRYLVGLEPHANTQAEPVRRSLEKIFRRSGVPEAILVDHGTPWWNGQGSGLTWLAVWLMKQGVRLCFSGFRHPQTQGKVERFHRCLKDAWRLRGPLEGDAAEWLEEFRVEYNEVRPHAALGLCKPAQRWSRSERIYVENPPAWEYPDGALVRRLGWQGQLFIDGRRYEVTRALAHEYVRVERVEPQVLVFYCASLVRVIDLNS